MTGDVEPGAVWEEARGRLSGEAGGENGLTPQGGGQTDKDVSRILSERDGIASDPKKELGALEGAESVPRESADSVFDEVSGWKMEGRSCIKSHPRVTGIFSFPYRSGMQ